MAACGLLAFGLSVQPGHADADGGKAVYRSSCADCHGMRGEGDGPGGDGMDPPPTSFAAGVFKHGDTDEALAKSIREGIPGTSMPAWPDLTDTEIADLVALIRKLKR